MPRFKQHEAGKNGWSEWVSPLHGHGNKNYKMACCDCGLVHDIQFRVKKDIKNRYSVIMRMRRNNRSTGQIRRRIKRQEIR
jgi:hypothetical protein